MSVAELAGFVPGGAVLGYLPAYAGLALGGVVGWRLGGPVGALLGGAGGAVAAALLVVVVEDNRRALDESGAATPSDAALRRRLAVEAAKLSRARGDAAEVARLNRRRDAQRARRSAASAATSCCEGSSDWRGDVFRRWRPPVPIRWDDAYRECFRESEEASLLGDYSKPASRRCVLGKMHALKLAQWESCRRECATRSSSGAVELWANEDGSSYLKGPGGSYLARLSDDGGWVVEDWSRGGGVVSSHGGEAAAVAAARKLAGGASKKKKPRSSSFPLRKVAQSSPDEARAERVRARARVRLGGDVPF